jgi:hypothetical protein
MMISFVGRREYIVGLKGNDSTCFYFSLFFLDLYNKTELIYGDLISYKLIISTGRRNRVYQICIHN